MLVGQLIEQFGMDLELEGRILGLMAELDDKGDWRQEEIERVYFEVRNQKYTARQLVTIARERFNLLVSDEVMPLLTTNPDAELNRDMIVQDFANRILLYYLEEKYSDLYGRIQRMGR